VGALASDRLSKLRHFLETDPSNWNLRADVFDAALEAGEFELAKNELARALAERPGDPGWLHREGVLQLARREFESARSTFQALIAAGHDAPGIRYNLAFADFSLGRHEAAVELLEPMLAMQESALMALPLWLRCHHHLDQSPKALEAFRAIVKDARSAPEAAGLASLMAYDEGIVSDAARWSAAALQGRPDQVEALVTQGSLALGHQDVPRALAAFELALARSPADGRIWSGVGIARMMTLDLPAAREAFRRAVTTMTDHQGTWVALGWCHLFLNEPAAAREAFEAALALDQNFAEGHGGLAVALARLGRTDDARREIQFAERLDPSGLSSKYAKAVLSGEALDRAAMQRLTSEALQHAQAVRSARLGPREPIN